MIKICKHCQCCKVNRPRGLCWTCYYTPGVKDQYGPVSKFGRRGLGNHLKSKLPLPERATSAIPGSEEKIRILMERVAKGQQLFHPEDLRKDGFELPEQRDDTRNGPRKRMESPRLAMAA
jgi:hypothetical protein